MKLVGLKTVEMAREGRFNTVVTSVDRSHSHEDSNYMTKAMAAGNELMERQKLRLTQLISLLKKIESQVNSSQNSIFQNLANHQAFMKKFFMKTFSYVSAVHQSGQSNDLSNMMLKILKATSDQVGIAIRSVEVGVDNLVCELAEKMCNPMAEYVNGLKIEVKTGISLRLLEIAKEMDEAIKIGQLELEVARNQARLAEQSRLEALIKLQKAEETAKKLTISLGLLIEDAPESQENPTQQEPLHPSTKEDQTAKDDNLLWNLLRNERKFQEPNNYLETNEPSGMETRSKRLKLAKLVPSHSNTSVITISRKLLCSSSATAQKTNTKSQPINSRKMLCSSSPTTARKANTKSQPINSRKLLGSSSLSKDQKENTKSPFISSKELLWSSPAAPSQKLPLRKRITP
ncbi:uncharacterized protein LOC127266391 isoform X2 [Andrographis paniculata]|nr:uncharacterized protein LOC127266391 isoform X2 [Andrographis paniculata]